MGSDDKSEQGLQFFWGKMSLEDLCLKTTKWKDKDEMNLCKRQAVDKSHFSLLMMIFSDTNPETNDQTCS